MKDSQDWLDEIVLRALTTAPNNMQEKTINDKTIIVFEVQNYKVVTSTIRKHILQEALSLIGDDLPLDTEPNTGQRIHNKVKQELRNKFNDKYKED